MISKSTLLHIEDKSTRLGVLTFISRLSVPFWSTSEDSSAISPRDTSRSRADSSAICRNSRSRATLPFSVNLSLPEVCFTCVMMSFRFWSISEILVSSNSCMGRESKFLHDDLHVHYFGHPCHLEPFRPDIPNDT